MKKIYLLITDAGGGHRMAAVALKSIFECKNIAWNFQIINFYQEILPQLGMVHPWLGKYAEAQYINIQRKNLGWLLKFLAPPVKFLMKLFHKTAIKKLAIYWEAQKPHLVISLMPLINGVVRESLDKCNHKIPFVTIITDFHEWSAETWISGKNQYYICATQKAEEQVQKFGVDPRFIYRTQGLLVHEKFYQSPASARHLAKKELGLDAELPIGVVMFGSYTSKVPCKILNKLKHVKNYQLIFICGHNKSLVRILSKIKTTIKSHIVGFTDQVPYYMQLADFFIGKPGPNSVSEALVSGLPVILESSFHTMPQEKFVAEWVLENKVGLVATNYDQLDQLINKLLAEYQHFKKAVVKLNNQAIFAMPDILHSLMGEKFYAKQSEQQ